jgi:hypothetical protein
LPCSTERFLKAGRDKHRFTEMPCMDGFSSQHIGRGLVGNCRLETMTATGLFLLPLSVASGCADTISQSNRRKGSLYFAAPPLSERFYLPPFLTPRA